MQKHPGRFSSGTTVKKTEPQKKPIAVQSGKTGLQKKALQNQFKTLLDNTLIELKGQSMERKVEIKQAFIADTSDYAKSFIKTAKPGHDDVFAYRTVWLFDVGRLDEFLEHVVIAQTLRQQVMHNPKQTFLDFRDWKIMDWAFDCRNRGESYEPYLTQVFESITDWDKKPKKQKEGYWYLKFHQLLESGQDTEELINFGKKAWSMDAQIKTKLRELFKLRDGSLANWKLYCDEIGVRP